jgi:hypothetical protein
MLLPKAILVAPWIPFSLHGIKEIPSNYYWGTLSLGLLQAIPEQIQPAMG